MLILQTFPRAIKVEEIAVLILLFSELETQMKF
jgi:hypothetical protein